MCQFKSMLILKDRVFVPDYDSHEDMLSELGIKDDMLNAQKTFVRAELLPKDDDVFSDIGTWEFHIDQDIRPDWFDENTDRERAVDAVKEWAKKHIRIDEDGIRITDGIYYIKNCKDVTALNNSTVEAWGNSTVIARGNSTVKNSIYLKWSKKDEIILYDNAIFRDIETKTIYHTGGWKLAEAVK